MCIRDSPACQQIPIKILIECTPSFSYSRHRRYSYVLPTIGNIPWYLFVRDRLAGQYEDHLLFWVGALEYMLFLCSISTIVSSPFYDTAGRRAFERCDVNIFFVLYAAADASQCGTSSARYSTSDSGLYPLRRMRYTKWCRLFLPGPRLCPDPMSTAYSSIFCYLDYPARVGGFPLEPLSQLS